MGALLFGAGMGIFAIYQLVLAARQLAAGLRGLAARVVSVGQAPAGTPCWIRGRVAAGEETVTSPLERQPCVYTRLSVGERVVTRPAPTDGGAYDRDREQVQFRSLGTVRALKPFWIEDEEGRAQVDGEVDAWVRPAQTHGPAPGGSLPARVIETVEALFGERARAWVAPDLPLTIRVQEFNLKPGDAVFVRATPDRSQQPPRLLPADGSSLRISDTSPQEAGQHDLFPAVGRVVLALALGAIAAFSLSVAKL